MLNFYIAYATSKVYHQIKVIAESEEDAKKQIALNNFFSWEELDDEDFQIQEVIFDGTNKENENDQLQGL
jgi:hypothetical protein